jgi:hypothetical protein
VLEFSAFIIHLEPKSFGEFEVGHQMLRLGKQLFLTLDQDYFPVSFVRSIKPSDREIIRQDLAIPDATAIHAMRILDRR